MQTVQGLHVSSNTYSFFPILLRRFPTQLSREQTTCGENITLSKHCFANLCFSFPYTKGKRLNLRGLYDLLSEPGHFYASGCY